MVDKIRDCGREIINHAEELTNKFKYLGGVKITIEIEPNEPPLIKAEQLFYPETWIERISK